MKTKILLLGIIILFLITRLYKIDQIPSSVYWDEASIGVNAYSIAKIGKDEWGKFLPIHFRAFGEFKLPVYIYSVVPFVKLFGLNEFSVRIPAVLFSLGVIILTYLLAKRLLNSETVGLWSSFFMTISPWFFIFSRTGYEVTAGLMFYLLAIFFFLQKKIFLQNKNSGKFILLSVASFIASAYSYNSFRVVAPLTFIMLIIFEKNNLQLLLKQHTFYILISVVLLILSIIPIFRLYVYDAGIFRLQVVGSSPASVIGNYLSHFNPYFLFISGDKNLRSQQANFPQIFLPDLILITMALIYIIGRKSKYGLLTLLLLLMGPIPAALTKESPHALRALSAVPFYAILSASGVFYLKKMIKIEYLLESVVVIIFLGFFANYFINFINVYPAQSSKDWQYGYKRIYSDYGSEFPKYDHIIISDEYAQPYIFALFYLRYDPKKFQKEVIRNSVDQWGFSTVAKFDRFEFGKVDKLLKVKSGKSLIFAHSEDKILNALSIGSIEFLDGNTAFQIYEK